MSKLTFRVDYFIKIICGEKLKIYSYIFFASRSPLYRKSFFKINRLISISAELPLGNNADLLPSQTFSPPDA